MSVVLRVLLFTLLKRGAVFSFSQSPGTSPDCHHFLDTMESGHVQKQIPCVFWDVSHQVP